MRVLRSEAGANPRPFLELARVPGTVTAAANVLAGYWVASEGGPLTLGLAGVAAGSMLLYGGGVALNDWFDRENDAEEHPLRPIPSGRVSARAALAFGASLVLGGVALAALGGLVALAVAAGIGALILSYDAVTKHSRVLGPLNMGLLRGFNFCLGLALVPGALAEFSPLALAHVAFIAALTLLARGEDTGGTKQAAGVALALAGASYLWVALLVLPYAGGPEAAPFLLAFAGLTGWRFWQAFESPRPSRVHAAVKAGVLGLVLLDAAYAAAGAGLAFGVAVASLLLPAFALAKAIRIS